MSRHLDGDAARRRRRRDRRAGAPGLDRRSSSRRPSCRPPMPASPATSAGTGGRPARRHRRRRRVGDDQARAGRHLRLAAHERPGHHGRRAVHERVRQAREAAAVVVGVTGDDGSAIRSAPRTAGGLPVTVPAGETVKVPLKVDPTAKLEAAQYGDVTGRIVATGDAKVSTPFSLYVTPETVTLTVRMKDRLGNPANSGSSVDVVNIDSIKAQRAFNAVPRSRPSRCVPAPTSCRASSGRRTRATSTPDTPGSVAYFGRPESRSPATRPSTSTRPRRTCSRSRRTGPVRPGRPSSVLPHLGRHVDPLRLLHRRPDGDRRLCRRPGKPPAGHLGVR